MGIRALLNDVLPLTRRILAGVLPPDDPSAVAAGIDVRPWLHRLDADTAALFVALVEAAWLIARSDGRVDRKEGSALREMLRALSGDGVGADDVDAMLDDLEERARREGPEARCAAAGAALARYDAARDGLRLAVAEACVTDGVSEAERATLGEIARSAGVDEASLDVLVAEVTALVTAAHG